MPITLPHVRYQDRLICLAMVYTVTCMCFSLNVLSYLIYSDTIFIFTIQLSTVKTL